MVQEVMIHFQMLGKMRFSPAGLHLNSTDSTCSILSVKDQITFKPNSLILRCSECDFSSVRKLILTAHTQKIYISSVVKHVALFLLWVATVNSNMFIVEPGVTQSESTQS